MSSRVPDVPDGSPTISGMASRPGSRQMPQPVPVGIGYIVPHARGTSTCPRSLPYSSAAYICLRPMLVTSEMVSIVPLSSLGSQTTHQLPNALGDPTTLAMHVLKAFCIRRTRPRSISGISAPLDTRRWCHMTLGMFPRLPDRAIIASPKVGRPANHRSRPSPMFYS